MKKGIALLFTLISLNVLSCDVCGGATSTLTQGLLPTNQFHFVGIRYGYRQFQRTHPVLLSSKEEISVNNFHSWNLMGRWQFHNRVGVEAVLPIVNNTETFLGEQIDRSGLGDASLRFNVTAIEQQDSLNQYVLRCFTGAKFPTGRFSREASTTTNLFQGTGSYDFTLGTQFLWSNEKWGLLNDVSYTFKTTNSVGFKFGNSISAALSAFWKLNRTKQWRFLPSIGAVFQSAGRDQIDGITLSSKENNNGLILLGEIGLKITNNQWMFGVGYQQPMMQNLASGRLKNTIGNLQIDILFLIKRKK